MLKKEITFIYEDAAQISMYKPIADEARERGYVVKMTDDMLAKCEIGFYCHHVNFPECSKFSVILLHDIIQQYSNWPDIWFLEPWNKYDIGILPSNQWVENWNKCSQWFYTKPKKGVFLVGWPKADIVDIIQEVSERDSFYKRLNLDISKKTVLYAPAWENDNKQDDFVRSMMSLDVNILIKQAPWNATKYPEIVKNIQEMNNIHKENDRVRILPPETNIFEAIAVSDILVSEESSTMCEAVMMGIPAVSVSDWLIPDTTPSRYPKCDYDFVTKISKNNLNAQIRDMLANYVDFKHAAEMFSKDNFSNIGNTSKIIMDIVDDAIRGRGIRYKPLEPKSEKCVQLTKLIKFNLLALKRAIDEKYSVKFPLLGSLLKLLRRIKHTINVRGI